jgi:hypothetical protein
VVLSVIVLAGHCTSTAAWTQGQRAAAPASMFGISENVVSDRLPGGAALSAPLNKHNPSTKYTTACAGGSRRRFLGVDGAATRSASPRQASPGHAAITVTRKTTSPAATP